MTTFVWIGGGNNLWSAAGNWNPGSGPPGNGDEAVIGVGKTVVESAVIPDGAGELILGFALLSPDTPSSLTIENIGFTITAPSFLEPNATLAVDVDSTIYFIFTGDLTNSGTLLLGQSTNSGGNGVVDIDGSVTLTGGGTVDLGQQNNTLRIFSSGSIGNSPLSNDPDGLINSNNTIVGGGSIKLTTFDNQAGGTVEASQGLGNSLQIFATTFSNEGTMVAESRATLDLGNDGEAGSLTNRGTISIDGDGDLAISGNFMIIAGGDIAVAAGASGAKITSDGQAATFTNDSNIEYDGSGQIGDDNLTFVDDVRGDVDVTGAGNVLTLNTGSNTIFVSQGGVFLAEDGAQMNIDSAVDTGGSRTGAGTIEAFNGGTVTISSAITTGSQITAGAIVIAGGTVVMASGATDTTPITFDGGGTLQLDSDLNTVGTISGMAGGDILDLRYVLPGNLAVFFNAGTLTLFVTAGGAMPGPHNTVAAFTLSGSYTSSNFLVTSDGAGGVQIDYVNAQPPSATTADMIMIDGSDGDYEIYDLGGNAIQSAYQLGSIGTAWQVAGVGGFDGADTSDMILRNSSTGAFEVYDISNNNITNIAAMGAVGLEWQVAGFGDFSTRSGETDMLMRDSNSGAFEIYDLANNGITFSAPMGAVGLEWSVAGFGDFSGIAGETDMLMRNSNTGAFEIYDISNNQLTSSAPMGAVGLEWSVAGFGDFSGNANETDMLMRDSNTGAFEIYDISNNGITFAAPMGAVGLEWAVVGFGPINGAGTSDMLMRDTNTGAFEVYDITNNQLTTAASMGAVGLEWQVAGIAADPPGGAAAANTQLTQTMASYAPSAPSPAGGSPIAAVTQVDPVSQISAPHS